MKTFYSFLFSLLLITNLFSQVSLTRESLLAYYNFEADGRNQIDDRFHFTSISQTGASTPTFTAGGKFGSKVDFNGSNALYLENELGNWLEGAENKSLSISFWLGLPNGVANNKLAMSFFDNIQVFTPNIRVAYSSNVNNNGLDQQHNFFRNQIISGSGWNHFVIQYNASTRLFEVYHNGARVHNFTLSQNSFLRLVNKHVLLGAGWYFDELNYLETGMVGSLDEMYIYNRTLTQNEINDLFRVVQPPVSELNPNKLLAYYPFDNDYKNAISDEYHLSLTRNVASNYPVIIEDYGIKGGAVRFDYRASSGEQNSLRNEYDFGNYFGNNNPDKSISVSLWVNNSSNHFNNTLYRSFFEFFESFYLRPNNFGIATNTNNWVGQAITAIPNDTWVHMVSMYDANKKEISLYINGGLVASRAGVNNFHLHNLALIVGSGSMSSVVSNNSKGIIAGIDEMYIFNRVLSGDEISALTNLVPIAAGESTVNFSSEDSFGTVTGNFVLGAEINTGTTIENGSSVLFNANPNFGYRLKAWKVNGQIIEDRTSYIVRQVMADLTVTASFERDPMYAIIQFGVRGDANGTITAKHRPITVYNAPSNTADVRAGAPYTFIQSGDFVVRYSQDKVTELVFEATPNTGYKIDRWYNNGQEVIHEDPYSNTYSHYEFNDLFIEVAFIVAETSVRNARFETLTLYPNPARDMVHIVAESNIDRVEIYTLSGALLQTEKAFGARNVNIQLGNMNEGMYIVKTYTDEGLQTAKLQVQR